MAKKLTVPQTGTQPAKESTPMENMINGHVAPLEQPKETIVPVVKSTDKRPVNFLCDAELLYKFKLYCARNRRTMTSVLENAITQILKGDELSSYK